MDDQRNKQDDDRDSDAGESSTESATPSESGGRSWDTPILTPAGSDDESMSDVDPADGAASEHPKGRDLADRS